MNKNVTSSLGVDVAMADAGRSMVGDIISLKPLRKAKERTSKEALASANRIRFGRTKHEKNAVREQAAKAARHLDAHMLGPNPESKGEKA